MRTGNTMASEELSCRDLVEAVTDYLEGALPATDAARFEEHLASCRGCRTYLDQVRRTVAVTGALPLEGMPHPVRDRLLRIFETWKSERAGS